MKVIINKATNEGEALSIEIPLNTPTEWMEKVKPALDMLDARLREVNQRYIEAFKAKGIFPKKYHMALNCLIDAIHGHRIDQLSNIPKLLEDAGAEVNPDVLPQTTRKEAAAPDA